MKHLFASGLGLIVSSRGVLAQLDAAHRFTLREADDPLLHRLIDEQRVVLLNVGSPELDYDLNVVEEISVDRTARLVSTVEFGLEVLGGAIVIRDGSDLEQWDPNGDAAVFDVEDDYYAIEAGWEKSPRHDHMIITFHLRRSAGRLPLRKSTDLIYEV